jgi:hypothetical protein
VAARAADPRHRRHRIRRRRHAHRAWARGVVRRRRTP